jgi:hypothetical protein
MSDGRQAQPDDTEPTPERQAELQAAYEANMAAGKPPYQGVRIDYREELNWIVEVQGWSVDLEEVGERPNLSGAIMVQASLAGANLAGAQLSGADMREAVMDATTRVQRVIFSRTTRLRDVVWNGVPLTQVTWVSRLGDEREIKEAVTRQDRVDIYHDIARAYRGLSLALRSQGLLISASNYRLREQVLERKATFWERKLLSWVFSWLLNLVAGYGERPIRAFFAYVAVLIGFAATFFVLGSGVLGLDTHDALSSPLAALVFSVTSFHGRGFFPGGGLPLDDPITVLAALEAIMGLFIEITFIATFTQRFFAR